jgi:hypothetical protein
VLGWWNACAGATYATNTTGEGWMDQQRFDALTRKLASRRGALRQAGVAATLFALFGSSRQVSARCNYEGCGCSTGTHHACGSGLICCASSPGTPGGAGVCLSRADCDAPCVDHGYTCPNSCNWGDSCSGCCSGFCGQVGVCDDPSVGAPCGGPSLPCDPGLVCCPYVPGLAGGAGVCQYRCR